jgi:hypothetical protein
MVRLFEERPRPKACPCSARRRSASDRLSYVQLVGEGVAAIDVGFPMRYSHSGARGRAISDLEALTRLILAALARIGPDFRTEREMSHDYTSASISAPSRSKGVLVDASGRVVAQAARARDDRAAPGWAEHRAEEDWWGDFVHVTRADPERGCIRTEIAAVACSAIGPCMLPVDAGGAPLMNGVLYGVDTRAGREIEELTAAIGEDVILDRCGNALTSQSVGPKILWLKRNAPRSSRQDREDPDLDQLSVVHR